MQLFPLFSLLLVPKTHLRQQQQQPDPSCRECIHYQPYPYIEDYELGRCKKFGYKDSLSGDIVYSYADFARMNSTQCSVNGTHFKNRYMYSK